jgi:hypothetical protein
MIINNLKISKTFKTHRCQQHLLDLTKNVTPLKKNEKKIPLLFTTFINRFEGSCGTFGEEKQTHCHQQHWVNLPNIYIYIYITTIMGWMLA